MEAASHQSHESRVSRGLRSPSFLGLLATQLFGATNDNTLRWLVIGIGKQYVSPENVSLVLSLGSACFVLPYLLLAAPAGYFADRFSKRSVIIGCKFAEIVIMVAAIGAILLGNIYILLGVVALMGSQSALFGPAKFGSIPEILPATKISSANGLMGLTTVLATVFGTLIGNLLAHPAVTGQFGAERWWISAIVLVGIAVAGWLLSLLIKRVPAANPERVIPWNFARVTWNDLKALLSNRPLFRVSLGIMFFWTLGMLATLNIDQFGAEGGAEFQTQNSGLLVSLVVGVGLGSVLAGYWSAGKVELGILPLGAGGLAIFSLWLFTIEGQLINSALELEYTVSYFVSCFLLGMLGLCAGMFDVPLEAYLQHHAPPKRIGSILAASNFLTFLGMLIASAGYSILRTPILTGEPLFSARSIFLLCGAFTVFVFVYIVWSIPQASIRFFVWLATHTIYRVRVRQRENLPEEGGALLVANHVSWIDAGFLVAATSRQVRILVGADLLTSRWAKGLAKVMGAIPIGSTPKAAKTAIDTARADIEAGELVCIFPEGAITRTGAMREFKPGAIEISKGTSAPIVPVYLDGVWGSIFSFERGRFFWKWPRHWFKTISIWFGPPMDHAGSVGELRLAVQELGAIASTDQGKKRMIAPRAFIRACRRAMFRWKIVDSTTPAVSGASLLLKSLVLRRLLLREVLADDEKYVGILLPPSVGGAITNAAVTLSRRVAVNLNYSVDNDTVNACIRKACLKHVLTSQRVLDKLEFKLDCDVVLLEDFKERVRLSDKLAAATAAFATPAAVLDRRLGLNKIRIDDEMTVIFTSGSTGDPKGVVLTYGNIGSNIEAVQNAVHFKSDDVLLGVLPFFHSFGYTLTLWTVLSLDFHGVYHFTPLDARMVGKLCGEHGVNIMMGTATFFRSYLKRCTKEDFHRMEVFVAGAEKLPISLCDAFEEKFGFRPIEGYGTTELSPLVSVNIPATRSRTDEIDAKEGTVGRPIEYVSAKTVHPDTLEPTPTGEPGMLLIKGPNVMKGYLGEPEKTAEVIRDGWYVTGDIAEIDVDGFIKITGRISRFSKLGGEMVPHIRIEEALLKIIGQVEDEPLRASVTAVPDARKGERLVVVHTDLGRRPDDICKALAEAGLPKLWIPSPDSFVGTETLPVLATGKLDLKGIARVAREHFCEAQPN